MEERRFAAMHLLQSRQTSHMQVARQMGVDLRSVRRWSSQLHSGGELALHRRPKPGRKPRLNAEQWSEALQILERGAQAAGFPTERWTLARIQSVIQRHFGVHYNANYLSERLHHFDWSVQKPVVFARERRDTLVESWLKGDWPRIKKSLSDWSTDSIC